MIALNDFRLDFDAAGALNHLSHQYGPNYLHQTNYEFPLGKGRVLMPRGWDECFPTIEAFGGYDTMGALIGNPPALHAENGRISQRWAASGITAERTFSSPATAVLRTEFEARNTGATPIKYLWASHALFSVRSLVRAIMPDGQVLNDFSLKNTCTKFFVSVSGPVILEQEESVITLSTDQPFWGIWLNQGGWPQDSPAGFCCIGIEATNCAGEIPADAVLPAGGVFKGEVIMKVGQRSRPLYA